MNERERWQAIEAKARALIAAVDHNLDERPWPWKYAVPWKEATELRAALLEPTSEPALMGRIPPGPRDMGKTNASTHKGGRQRR